MFARIKKSGKNEYLQIVENRREGTKIRQRVLVTLGRLDEIQEKDRIETLIRTLNRFSRLKFNSCLLHPRCKCL